MSSLKDMYRTVLKDTFPDTMTITLGDAVLTYKKRTWHIDGETKGLRYGENGSRVNDQNCGLCAVRC